MIFSKLEKIVRSIPENDVAVKKILTKLRTAIEASNKLKISLGKTR